LSRISVLSAAALALCAACGAGRPGPAPDPLQILAAADSSTMAVERVEYSFRIYGTGDFESIPEFSGTARLVKETGSTPPMMWVHFTPATLETGEALPDLTLSTDGITVWALDRSAMWFATGLISEGGSDLLQPAYPASMMEFAIESPFQAEIAGDSVVWEGIDSVAGVPCDVVYVVYEGGQGAARWYFGTEDRLPHKVERSGLGGAQGTQILELASITPNAAFDNASFVLSAPDSTYSVETYRTILDTGSPAPSWTLSTPDGRSISLESLRGKVVVLDFWATWCGPCAQAMPGMQSLYQEFAPDSLEVIGVNVWEEAGSDPAAFAAEKGITYTIVVNGDSTAAEYGVDAIPTFYVIDRQGRVAWGGRGFDAETEQALRAAVEAAIGAR
jgi:cytochrome c biogenesis protein CcmG, thiol:disulfide interchange protein DsbE